MFVSVIITTYNRPVALAMVLRGVALQTVNNFEVIVADDGSNCETAELIAMAATWMAVPLYHVWQEDRGFRAATVRNKALARAVGDYVIFIDGDCIPRPNFVAAHLQLAEPGWFVAGSRILFSESFTRRMLTEKPAVTLWPWYCWCYARGRRWINRLFPLISLPDGKFRKHKANQWQGAKTCNLAAWRCDLRAVNGFDESYVGWGHEDADLVVRLIRAGVYRKEGRFATTVLHLWHRENDRHHLADNEKQLAAVLSANHVRATFGLDQYL
jgi:glycosyltransferase involved in cell wall biosynthesis